MAHLKTTKTDPVRTVLAILIDETQAKHTPDSIIREFRATADKRRSNRELLLLLESISCKRPNYRNVLDEIRSMLERKDPMYALLVFAERINGKFLWPSKTSNALSPLFDMPPPLSLSSRNTVLSGASSSDLLTPTTPLNSRSADENIDLCTMASTTSYGRRAVDPADSRADLRQIKQRVLNAVSTRTEPGYDKIVKHSKSGNKSVTTNGSSISPGNADKNASADDVWPSLVLADAYSRKTENGDHNHNAPPSNGLTEEYHPTLLWDYYKVDDSNSLCKQSLSGLPLDTQQNLILEDLIYVLNGVRGAYIQPLARDKVVEKYETRFTIHNELDKSLAELAQEILPLASHYMGIQIAISNSEGRGQVISALNAQLTVITKEYHILISQAEEELHENQLSLSKLQYYLQPTMWVLHAICTFVVEMQTNNCHGAAVLSLLGVHIKRLEGDKSAQEAIISLAQKAAAPYMTMLQAWIQKGIIVDPTREFLVEDNEVIHIYELPEHYSDDYWERRYTVRDKCIPKFLEGHSDKILRTGKYLNVIRQCGKRMMPIQNMNLKYDPTNEQHVRVINDAYYFAARMLLDVLITENDLMGHLLSVRRYLLLHQGDFIMQFMDACEDELSKNVDQVLPITLENLLGLTLRLSSARGDPYKDYVHCGLLTYDLVTQMSKIINPDEENWKTHDRLDLSGMECFAFSYEVKWPVSLVLNHIAISKYQMLFRQLFYCKHVERQLCKIWKENSLTKKFSPQSAELYRSAFTLRQRMMNAVQNLEYYMMIEIIEPNWHIFIEKMKKVENVDMVLKLHHDFLDLCLKNCMLTETSHLNRAIFKLCKICLKFCDFIQTESKMDETDTFGERVKRFDLEFTGMLITFLKQINDLAKDNTTDLFMNLVHRINFNGFYSDQMEKLCVENAMG
ncbi:gamma-tubulin complex component 2 homolog isoform X2 [Drosophila grimshawi]|uniref:gamma-tubulin complex component 2 homolog isoform X2 n=1 Tax=Drosophila grimshawi TaxID=7222 RepID=UPI000C86ED99|nr:gamma-tubulin complex component 2 homolog isoform X2 [Drosophila grimshawi]